MKKEKEFHYQNGVTVIMSHEDDAEYEMPSRGGRIKGDWDGVFIKEENNIILTLAECETRDGQKFKEINVDCLAPENDHGFNIFSYSYGEDGKLVKQENRGTGTWYPKGDNGYHEERQKLLGLGSLIDSRLMPKKINFNSVWLEFGNMSINQASNFHKDVLLSVFKAR